MLSRVFNDITYLRTYDIYFFLRKSPQFNLNFLCISNIIKYFIYDGVNILNIVLKILLCARLDNLMINKSSLVQMTDQGFRVLYREKSGIEKWRGIVLSLIIFVLNYWKSRVLMIKISTISHNYTSRRSRNVEILHARNTIWIGEKERARAEKDN